jgi:hypothetical protein
MTNLKFKTDSQYLGFINELRFSEDKLTTAKLIELGYETFSFQEQYPLLFYKKKSFTFEGPSFSRLDLYLFMF